MSINPSLRVTWLCPDDKGGGVISVAEGCCKEAALAGHEATLLLAIEPTGHAKDFGAARLASLQAAPPYTDIPQRLVNWLQDNPQDILVLNACEQVDDVMPYLPASLHVIYAVHDTAERFYTAALRHEAQIDAIAAVSETVAACFRDRLRDPRKLLVVHNGTGFPFTLEETLGFARQDDLVFVGGDDAVKGAFDALALWPEVLARGFAGRLHWFGAVGEATRAQIARLPAADRIVLHGRQPRERIFAVAGQSRVVLMLSRVEPFGMVTVECMGMGCLVAAWDIETGTKEIATAADGAFAPLGNYAALAANVMQLLGGHGAAYAASTTRIRAQFSESAMWARYAAAIAAVVRTPPVSRALAGQTPPPYRAPLRLYQLLPAGWRRAIRAAVGRSPRIGYAVRDLRGK